MLAWEAEYLQNYLVGMFTVDSFTPYSLIPRPATATPEEWEKGTPTQWQWTVDWIYRLVSAGLLKLWPEGMLAGKSDLTFDGPLDFAQALAKQNPFAFEEISEKPVPWIGPNLCLTNKAKMLIAKYEMSDPRQEYLLNIGFIEEVEQMFDAAGVAWSESPLVPIRDANIVGGKS